jgi:choline dehydrogenase-like flavoprotein
MMQIMGRLAPFILAMPILGRRDWRISSLQLKRLGWVSTKIVSTFLTSQSLSLTDLEVNSGNPIGMGMGAGCMHAGARTTAAAFLKDPPSNLTIMTDSPIHKVLIDDSKVARGILTIDGRKIYANKEVILSAGALNTPQLLMLSGIGPRAELEKHNIPVIHEMSQIGQNLQDHCFVGSTLILKEGTNDRMTHEGDAEGLKKLREQYAKDRTGVLNSIYCSTPMGFFKSDAILNSEEFKSLPETEQERIKGATVPHFEIATVCYPLHSSKSSLTRPSMFHHFI